MKAFKHKSQCSLLYKPTSNANWHFKTFFQVDWTLQLWCLHTIRFGLYLPFCKCLSQLTFNIFCLCEGKFYTENKALSRLIHGPVNQSGIDLWALISCYELGYYWWVRRNISLTRNDWSFGKTRLMCEGPDQNKPGSHSVTPNQYTTALPISLCKA